MRILVVVGALWCVACFARVEPEPVEPTGTVEQASDPKVRHYSTPLAIASACWRVDAGCTCRELAADERAFGP